MFDEKKTRDVTIIALLDEQYTCPRDVRSLIERMPDHLRDRFFQALKDYELDDTGESERP